MYVLFASVVVLYVYYKYESWKIEDYVLIGVQYRDVILFNLGVAILIGIVVMSMVNYMRPKPFIAAIIFALILYNIGLTTIQRQFNIDESSMQLVIGILVFFAFISTVRISIKLWGALIAFFGSIALATWFVYMYTSNGIDAYGSNVYLLPPP